MKEAFLTLPDHRQTLYARRYLYLPQDDLYSRGPGNIKSTTRRIAET